MPLPPSGLLCELLRDPAQALITTAAPRFSWVVEDPARGARQRAYRILVASTRERLRPAAADLWDSGPVASDRSLHVAYAGAPLPAPGVCWWTVQTWDAEGVAGPFAAPQAVRLGDPARDAAWPGESRWERVSDGLGEAWLPERRQALAWQARAPAGLRLLPDGRAVADFARAAFATLELRLTSDRDDREVEIRLGEKARADGSVDPAPGGCIAYRSHRLRLARGTRTYRLDFPRVRCPMPGSLMLEAHLPEVVPFRYVEIVGAPWPVAASDLRQLVLTYPYDDGASAFATDDERLDRVYGLCRYSLQTLTFLGIYADGARERCPYEADAYVQQLGHYAIDREFAIARHSAAYLLDHGTWPTEWILISVFMAWADHLHTGDTLLIERCRERLAARTLCRLARDDGLLDTSPDRLTAEVRNSVGLHLTQMRDIVDWPHGANPGAPPGPRSTRPEGEIDGYAFTPVNTVVNAHHIHALRLMARIAAALGREDEAVDWRGRADRALAAFDRVCFDPVRGVYRDGEGTEHASLHANMFPLCFGLVAPERRAGVVAWIKSRGMACSCYGAHYLLEGLFDADEEDHALDLITAAGDRGWLHMLAVGSTVTTEAWDLRYKPNLGWSHAWSTAPAHLAARKLLGVEPLAPGFAAIRIRPRPGRLGRMSGTVPTIRGPVSVAWHRDSAAATLVVTIPANTSGEIHLPCRDPAAVRVDGRPLGEVTGVTVLRSENGRSVVGVGGGSYSFAFP